MWEDKMAVCEANVRTKLPDSVNQEADPQFTKQTQTLLHRQLGRPDAVAGACRRER